MRRKGVGFRIRQILLKIAPEMRGKENAITSKEIRNRFGLEHGGDDSLLRLIAKELLREGIPLVSCVKGFFIASSDQELEEYVNHLKKRAGGLDDSIAAVEEILDKRREARVKCPQNIL